eukprot:CAMPEP_0119362344 /NCGR_PEP_ID=MMETSP1334-20130426/9430_1 /TAXON_ID=127549 /ORGANISM="Calcidiscus leptoporus, Strain RCC1130" /LENGTH=78 /DNA_ID=CAMNT_0007377541 /DNA_START=56 /DNA_END=288 /DNA_ORIENTATION=-
MASTYGYSSDPPAVDGVSATRLSASRRAAGTSVQQRETQPLKRHRALVVCSTDSEDSEASAVRQKERSLVLSNHTIAT